jgi:hypothetical protein
MKLHIDLCNILQKKTGGEKSSKTVTLNVKGEDNEQTQERNIRSMKTRGETPMLPFYIDVKGGEKHEEKNIERNFTRGV